MSFAKAVAHQTFSTKKFVPGHVAGAAAILFGTIALAKVFIARHETELREHQPIGSGARAENDRGQYGKRRGSP